jgi:hypothetical protein
VILLSIMANKGIGCGGVLMIFIFIGMECYPPINRTGWIWHKRTVDMYAKDGWRQGETRKCTGFRGTPTMDYLLCFVRRNMKANPMKWRR